MKTYDPSVGSDDEFINSQNTELYEALIAELKSSGYHGLHIDSIDDRFVHATIRASKTVEGKDVYLNAPEGASEDDMDKALETYLDQACELVCGCDLAGEWTGNDWHLSESYPIKVTTVLNEETLQLDARATASSLYEAAQVALEHWDREAQLLDEFLNLLTGWTDRDGKEVEQGRVTEYSAFRLINEEKSFDP